MKTTEGPMKTTEGPMKTTEGPMKTTEGPMKTTEGPMKTTEGPMKTTEGPMKTTQGPGGARFAQPPPPWPAGPAGRLQNNWKPKGGGPFPKTPSPPPQTKGTIVGHNEIYNRESVIVPFLVHKLMGPPPLPAQKTPWGSVSDKRWPRLSHSNGGTKGAGQCLSSRFFFCPTPVRAAPPFQCRNTLPHKLLPFTGPDDVSLGVSQDYTF